MHELYAKNLEKNVFMNDILNTYNNVGIVIGDYKEYESRVDKAYSLYESNYINKLILCGGIGLIPKLSGIFNEPQCNLMLDYATSLGMPKDILFTECQANITYEKILYSISYMVEKDIDFNNIVLISSDYHLKRCYLIAKMLTKQIKDVNLQAVGSYYEGINKDNWSTTIGGKVRVRKEYMLSRRYDNI